MHTGLACHQEKPGQYWGADLCRVIRTGKLNGSSELRTEGFCLIPLVILPQSVLQDRLGGEVVLDKGFPEDEAKFLATIHEVHFQELRV